MRKRRFLSLLMLLIAAVTGATAQTTYKTTLKDGTEDAANWSAAPNPAREGQSVTIKYNGKKKVKRVTTVKKETNGKAAAAATAEDQGKLIAANGKIYDTQDAATLAGTTAVAKIIYVGSSTDNSTYTHGLALALTDESSKMQWSTAIITCSAKNTLFAVTDASWMLPSMAQWNQMIDAAGGCTALRDGFSSVGGTNLRDERDDYYWSSTELVSVKAWLYYFNDDTWCYDSKDDDGGLVRACLAF